MKNILRRLVLITVIGLLMSNSAHAYVYCETKVTEIYPHISNGHVYFKFSDGTSIQETSDKDGLDRNMSVALSALMAGKSVKVALNDGGTCGVNNATNWSYIVAIQ
jgi:hypothetical protein